MSSRDQDAKARLEEITAACDTMEPAIGLLHHYAGELDSDQMAKAVKTIESNIDEIYYTARAAAGYTDLPGEWKYLQSLVQERSGWRVEKNHADCTTEYFARRGPGAIGTGVARIKHQERHGYCNATAYVEKPCEDGEGGIYAHMLIHFGKNYDSVDAAKTEIEKAFAEHFK